MKNFKLLKYMINIICRADKTAFVWLIIYTIWCFVPAFFDAIIYKLLIESIAQNKTFVYVIMIVGVYSLILLIRSVFGGYVYDYRFKKLELNVKKFSNILFLEKCEMLDMECYDEPEFYDKLSRSFNQVNSRAMQVFYQFTRLFYNIVNLIVGIFISIIIDPFMLIVAILFGIIGFFMDISFVKRRVENEKKLTPINRIVDYLQSLLYSRSTVSDVKQFDGFSNLIIQDYKNAFNKKTEMTMSIERTKYRHSIKSDMLVNFMSTLMPYTYLAIQCFRSRFTVADIPAMFNAYRLITCGFDDISREITNLKESCLYIEQFKAIMEYEPKIETNTGIELESIETIEFSNVSFRYPNSDENVLKNINIKIQKGIKIAIVGINGAGKTTLMKLLLRYYDPCDGRILINGIDLREYNIKSLRNKVATLFQEFQTYSMSLKKIISCSATPDDEKVIKVLKEVGLYEKVMDNPKNINCEYGKTFDEDGIVFSGGELQRMFIARMLYKNGDVYIMDEPNSALDPISEYEINNLMIRVAKEHTVILIAHRLSSTIKSDCIILMDNGEIIERGTHKELMQLNGKYSQMFTLQAKEYIS